MIPPDSVPRFHLPVLQIPLSDWVLVTIINLGLVFNDEFASTASFGQPQGIKLINISLMAFLLWWPEVEQFLPLPCLPSSHLVVCGKEFTDRRQQFPNCGKQTLISFLYPVFVLGIWEMGFKSPATLISDSQQGGCCKWGLSSSH